MRLIDADALIKAVEGNPFVTESVKSYVRMSVRKASTIEAEPVKRGHWIWEKAVLAYTCSLCHHFTYDGQPNYCPNCGARMDQEE